MFLYFGNMIHWLEEHELPCLFKKVFRIDCPGCGLQRSCIALLKGDILTSLKLYPALLPMLLFFIYLFINKQAHFRFSTKITRAGIAGVFTIILASYIYKIIFLKQNV